jgi:DNA-binding CsgD family transcriptional regulator
VVELSVEDYQGILDIINDTSSSDNVDSMRERLLGTLFRRLKADSALLLLSNGNNSEVDGSDFSSINVDNKLWSEFPLYRSSDPFYKDGGSSGSVLTVDEIMPYPEWEKSSFYNEFCRPLGIYHKMSVYLRRYDEMYGVICLCRTRNRPNFSEREKMICSLLAQPLANSLRLIGMASREGNGDGTGTPSPSAGVLMLDYNFNIVDINGRAKEYCGMLNCVTADFFKREHNDYKVPGAIIEVCSAIKKLYESRTHRRPLIYRLVPAGNGRHVRIEGSITHDATRPSSSPCFMVSLSEAAGQVMSQDWTSFNLTRRESEIATYVCQGLSNRHISEMLYISLNTVETHLKNIFRKTGIKNRTGLLLMESQDSPGY